MKQELVKGNMRPHETYLAPLRLELQFKKGHCSTNDKYHKIKENKKTPKNIQNPTEKKENHIT